MKSASPALLALLASNQFIMADLYTITLINGNRYRYTTFDADLVVSGAIYSSTGLMLNRGTISQKIGVEVDTLDLTIDADGTCIMEGVAFLQAIHNGILDNARVRLERVFMAFPGDASAGTVCLFDGRVADIGDLTRTRCELTINSDMELLNIQMPRNLYQTGCVNTLYDGVCGLALSGYQTPSVITSVSGFAQFTAAGLTQAAGYFTSGVVVFTSGNNAGLTRAVKLHSSGGVITMTLPLKKTSAVGDTFNIYPGCSKLQSVCLSKFNNQPKFRGFPYVPVVETAY